MITKFKLFENNFWGNHQQWMEYRYLDLEILEDGDLKISLNEEGKEEVEDSGIDEQKFYDYFDDVRANSELTYFDNMSDAGLGMSDAPCITDGYYFDDDGNFTDEEHEDSEVFWYPNYMIKDFTEELVENGYVIFVTNKPKTKEEIEEQRFKNNTKKYNL